MALRVSSVCHGTALFLSQIFLSRQQVFVHFFTNKKPSLNHTRMQINPLKILSLLNPSKDPAFPPPA